MNLKKLFTASSSTAQKNAPPRNPEPYRTVYEIYPNIEEQRRHSRFPDIKDKYFWSTFDKCKAYSMIGVDAFYNLYRSVEYLAHNSIPGDFVECGVFLGGAVLAMSEFAHHFGLHGRRFLLYDTFTGFASNTVAETDYRGERVDFYPHPNCMETVRSVLAQSHYPKEQFVLVPGMVEETLAQTKPAEICLLRLDTDYYESTRVELAELYPRLVSGGVLIIDDYGCFQGSRRATDEFLQAQKLRPLLSRVNTSVRAAVKP